MSDLMLWKFSMIYLQLNCVSALCVCVTVSPGHVVGDYSTYAVSGLSLFIKPREAVIFLWLKKDHFYCQIHIVCDICLM